MVRFFVSAEQLQLTDPVLIGENANHAKVLRLKSGDQVLLCDANENEAICQITKIESDKVALSVIEKRSSSSEPRVRVSVYVAFSKGEKLEHIIQKATELGAYEIVIYPSARCISRPDEKSQKKKLDRWQKIALSAAEQSGRGRVPAVCILGSFKDALRRANLSQLSILFYENEQSTTLQMAIDKFYDSISIMTGPEGGYEDTEVEEALMHGLKVCTLGKRILRCETAPLCALSAIMYASGEF